MSRGKKESASFTPEWSFTVEVEDIRHESQQIEFTADESQRANLSRRVGVEKILELSAQADVSPAQTGVIHVSGTFHAKVVQNCVVTLEPIETVIEDDFEGWFADNNLQAVSFAKAKKDRDSQMGHAEQEILDDPEDPDQVVNGKIDIGELAAQHLSLAIDPYPRAPGAEKALKDVSAEVLKPLSGRKNPFEALKDWKEKR